MLSKLFKGITVEDLETQLNDFFISDTNDGGEGQIRIDNVQQWTLGEQDKSTFHIGGQPQIKYIFCIIIFYYYA